MPLLTARRTSFAAIPLAVALTVGFTTAPANAAPDPSVERISDRTWEALQTGIDFGGVFDGSVAERAGAPAALVDDFATGWVVAGQRAVDASIDEAVVAAVASSVSARACAGRNRWDYTGLQVNVYGDSCVTARALGIITAGGGVAGAAATIAAATGVGAPIAGAIASGIAIAIGSITACGAKGRGIVVHMIPPTPAVWCNSQ